MCRARHVRRCMHFHTQERQSVIKKHVHLGVEAGFQLRILVQKTITLR